MILQRARACRRDGEGRVGVARDGSAACGLARKQLVFQWRDTGLAAGWLAGWQVAARRRYLQCVVCIVAWGA